MMNPEKPNQNQEASTNQEEKPIVAFLGPLGTYSHQAAYNYFGDKVEYRPEPTIAKVFSSLSTRVLYACLPFANSTHGQVIETLDLLRSERWSHDAFITGEITIKIQHCLVVPSEVESSREDTLRLISRVYSHEQALGQCAEWLQENLPNAKRIKTESTASAAQRLIAGAEQVADADDGGCSAAVCAEVCVTTYPGLRLLQKGIQDRSDNETRFLIVSRKSRRETPTFHQNPSYPFTILIRIVPFESKLNEAFSVLMANIFSHGLALRKIDRRPDVLGTLWEDVYFVEVVRKGNEADEVWDIWKGFLATLTPHMEVTTLGLW